MRVLGCKEQLLTGADSLMNREPGYLRASCDRCLRMRGAGGHPGAGAARSLAGLQPTYGDDRAHACPHTHAGANLTCP